MNNQENTLRPWNTPRLMRLNQADGTEKHLLLTEFGYNTCSAPTYLQAGVSGGVPETQPGNCGPS